MSDDFIPLNQSTPTSQARWNQGTNQNYSSQNRYQNKQRHRGGQNKWGNHSRNSSFGSDSNSSYNQEQNSFSRDRNNIDAYLHPSMLEDPWAKLKWKKCSKVD